MDLPPLTRDFVLHFGEMGARWGVNRTVGQTYALLYLSEEPLCADDLVARLGMSRSNVSMGLKELKAWELVRLEHRPDDRREFFSTPDELWNIVRTLVEQRRRREIDPTLSLLRRLQLEHDEDVGSAYERRRLAETTRLIELLTGWHDDLSTLDTAQLERLFKLGAALQKVLDLSDAAGRALGGRRRGGGRRDGERHDDDQDPDSPSSQET